MPVIIIDSAPIDDNGMVKVHGLDDTKKISEAARELSEKLGLRIVEVEVTTGSYEGVIYVIEPTR